MIALIITVIVMLILVGVTINVALKGDLFESAEKATTETEKYAILEQIIEMAVWNNGDIEVDTTEGIVATKEDVVNWNSTTGKLTIKGKKGTYDYKLSKREITIWEEKDNLPRNVFSCISRYHAPVFLDEKYNPRWWKKIYSKVAPDFWIIKLIPRHWYLELLVKEHIFWLVSGKLVKIPLAAHQNLINGNI